MSQSGRYLSPAEFCRLLADLRITDDIFQNGLLEFLEEERMVLPAARIHWPRSIVVEHRHGISAPSATPEERVAATALDDSLREWRRIGGNPEAEHPLDAVPPPAEILVSKNLEVEPFEPWASFGTTIQVPGNESFVVEDAVDTYYHDWQALLVADAVEMGVRVIMDTRRPELLRLAHELRASSLTGTRHYATVHYWSARGLADGVRWSPYFDAAARLAMVRDRMRLACWLNQPGPRELTNVERANLQRVESCTSIRLLNALGATRASIAEFLQYLCVRWDEWDRRGRAGVAGEYKRQIARSIMMTRFAYSIDFRTVATDVGRATGHFDNTLEVIFPDWERGAREKLENSLRHSVLPNAPAAGDLALTDADVSDFSAWLERRGFHKIHLSVEELLIRQFRNNSVDRSAMAKEVESLAGSVEHLINEMFVEVGIIAQGTLMPKMLRFWQEDPEVHAILQANTILVNTRSATRTIRLAEISNITSTSNRLPVAQVLLRSVLNRNSGTHQAMIQWPENELQDTIRDFLTTLMFCRKQMVLRPPRP